MKLEDVAVGGRYWTAEPSSESAKYDADGLARARLLQVVECRFPGCVRPVFRLLPFDPESGEVRESASSVFAHAEQLHPDEFGAACEYLDHLNRRIRGLRDELEEYNADLKTRGVRPDWLGSPS